MTAEVHHLLVPADEWRTIPDILSTVPDRHDVVVAVDGAATCALVGALADQWTRRIGVWLVVHDGYGAPLAARDVATLSWLVDLSTVIVSSADKFVVEHARLFAALLTGDEASVTTPAGSIAGAYNRPAPRAALRVATATQDPSEDIVDLSPLVARTGIATWGAARSSRRVRAA